MILEIRDVSKAFEGLFAVNRVSFSITPGVIKALIGPNGAGKTTLFNMVTGLLVPTRGRMFYRGRELNPQPVHVRAQWGISRTFQIVRPFGDMSVLENVMVGCHLRTSTGILSAALRLANCRKDEAYARDKALQEIRFVGLEAKARQLAGSLPMGDQRLMEIARALASDPELILMDEPAAGLNEKETDQLAENLLRIKSRGTTILLVEHDMRMVMKISDEIVVISHGTKIAEGRPLEIRSHPEVIAAYLGR